MKSSIRLGRLFGIEIGAHASWLIIVVLVTLSLAAHFGQSQPGWTAGARWSAALLTAVVFFASVVAHELAHSLVARRFGIPVRNITLFLFGGVSQIESEAKKPAEELLIAVVGPLTSFAIGGACLGGHALVGDASLAGAVLLWVGWVNLMLGAFNMLPGFPLDGGRVLRGLVWWTTGDQRKATRVAAGAGRVLATLMIVGGVMLFFGGGNAFSGLWFAFLGWFLLDAARFGARQAELQHALRGVVVRDIMTTECPLVSGAMPLDRFADEMLLRTGRRCFLVSDDGRVRGIVTPRDLQPIERARWPSLSVGDAMRPIERLRWVPPDAPAAKVMEVMGREDLNQVPVMEDGRLLGIVTREHLIRLLTTRMELEG